ncbi:hypothetical protein A6046_00325 [[Haemophilus] ducreyi]|uniref:Uncharacterized protein n=2 Tax=Haemophilus ducreyi TaxID=730 RepID=Q7VMG6_HAEDU|nr:hypothetical protein [[Haemophilus] ducreyi]AAP95890.1 hypothetical protein HD_1011 [[Haemophilus] ducreyi 35000HP]AKO30905.1 hypothetical protein RY60_04025 [[Haemophilus] ducreyi]AKO32344.1 hypothetical protein RZ57_04035 [[Haemophilus] ducreyi]AKO33798.1 hypothetical protein RZ58_04050 [[Haemophilus] ducreyi]AKO35245.1 hypothetical protein RZ59_04010 [[Haemophilus] ducreyi]
MNRIKLFTLLLFLMLSHVAILSAQNTDLPQVSFNAHLARSAIINYFLMKQQIKPIQIVIFMRYDKIKKQNGNLLKNMRF